MLFIASILEFVLIKWKTENLFLRNSLSQPSFHSFHRLCNGKSIDSLHLLIITAIWSRQVIVTKVIIIIIRAATGGKAAKAWSLPGFEK